MMRRLLAPLVIVCLAACSSIDCPVQNTVAMLYNIVGSDGASLTLTDTLTVATQRADGSDTILLNRAVDVSSFTLPVSYSHPEDILVFTFAKFRNTDDDNGEEATAADNETTDTVWVKKDDIPHFESVDCQAAFFHVITGVRNTRHYIDTIEINNRSVTYDQETVHLILHTKGSN